MSADLLRRAATRLRESALAATPGPWAYDPAKQWHADHDFDMLTNPQEYVSYGGPSPFTGAIATTGPANHAQSMRDAEFIALVHPPVALALADLLDRVYVTPMVMPSVVEFAELVAREVLREPGPATVRESTVDARGVGSVALPQAAVPDELSVTNGGEAARVAPPNSSVDLGEPEGGETP